MFVLVAVALSGVGGLAAYVNQAPANKIAYADADDKAKAHLDKQAGRTTKVPTPEVDDQGIRFGSEDSPTPKGSSPYEHVVREYLIKANFDSGSALEKVDLDKTVARIYLSEAFKTSMGSMDEATFLNGLRAALGQFPEIDSVELYAGGQKVDELGHMEISEPLPVIRPENWKNPTKRDEAPAPSGQG